MKKMQMMIMMMIITAMMMLMMMKSETEKKRTRKRSKTMKADMALSRMYKLVVELANSLTLTLQPCEMREEKVFPRKNQRIIPRRASTTMMASIIVIIIMIIMIIISIIISSSSSNIIDEIGNIFNFLELRTENSRRFRNFKILEREATFALRSLPEGTNTVLWLENVFSEVHAYALRSSEPGDYVGLSFDYPCGGSTEWSGGAFVSSGMRLNPRGHMGTREFSSSKCRRNRYRGKFRCAYFQRCGICVFSTLRFRLTRFTHTRVLYKREGNR